MKSKRIKLREEQNKVLFLNVNNPVQIKGVAGSGKTTIALCRAKYLMSSQSNLFSSSKVAIFAYNKTLVKYIESISDCVGVTYNDLNNQVATDNRSNQNIFVTNFHKWAYHFIEKNGIKMLDRTIQNSDKKNLIVKVVGKYSQHKISIKNYEFFLEEISWMKGRNFQSMDEYVNSKRISRGVSDRVTKADKEIIWEIYKKYNLKLKELGLVDFDDYAIICLDIIEKNKSFVAPFTHLVIDEAQDLNKTQILVLSKLVPENRKSITIIADSAQRIYKSGFTWTEVGINIQGGRTIDLRKNHRNTIHIIKAAVSLLEKDKDNSEYSKVETARKGEQKPILGLFNSWDKQIDYLIDRLQFISNEDVPTSTVILHRNIEGLDRVKTILDSLDITYDDIRNTKFDMESNTIKLCTMSSVKGLEFDNVFIIDLNEDTIPLPSGFADRDDDYHVSTERRLLYTSMTRAKEKLYLLSSGNPSRYLSEIDEEFIQRV